MRTWEVWARNKVRRFASSGGCPISLPLLLPWLVVLALLALPSNRNAAGVVDLGAAGRPGAARRRAGSGCSMAPITKGSVISVQAACAAASDWRRSGCWEPAWRGVAGRSALCSWRWPSPQSACWRLWSARCASNSGTCSRCGAGDACCTCCCSGYLGGLVYAGALNLTGWMCRSRFSALRVSLRLPFWLWVMWLVAGGTARRRGERLCPVDSFEWIGLLMAPIVLALVSFLMLLPYLILSFASSFYRERLKDLLRLPATEPSPAGPNPFTGSRTGKPALNHPRAGSGRARFLRRRRRHSSPRPGAPG